MKPEQAEYAAEHGREMAALVLMVNEIQQGNQDRAFSWAQRMQAACNAKMQMIAEGMSPVDADAARVSAEASFERENPGQYQAARGFMYSLKARMGR